MAAFTTLLNALFLPGKPITGITGSSLRDNLLAAFEGDATAIAAGVVLRDAALGLTPTTAGRDWIFARMALLAAAGGVGTLAFLSNTTTSAVIWPPGQVIAGSGLRYAGGSGASGTAPGGTWMSLGSHETGATGTIPLGDGRRSTLFIRIS